MAQRGREGGREGGSDEREREREWVQSPQWQWSNAMRCIPAMWDANQATIAIWGVGDAAPAYQSGSRCRPQVATRCLERLNQGMVTSCYTHTQKLLKLLNTQKNVQCIVTIRSLWANEAYYLCIDFKRFQRFQTIQALKYWSLSETVVVGAIPHRWLSARLRAKAYRFVKREKETWAKSCTYSTILRVPEAIIFYEDSHLSPIQSKSNAPIHCKSNTRLSFASIFLASICVGCWVLLCIVLRTKDF